MLTAIAPTTRNRYVGGAGLALILLLAITAVHRAHSQSGQDGPPAPLSGQRIALRDGSASWKVPACFSLPLDRPNASITRAVVGIHGLDRFANAAFGCLVEAGRAASADRTTLILAPQFVTETERDKYRIGAEVPVWKGSRWIQGDDSVARDDGASISSYRIVDLLLERLADRRIFPNLRSVVVAGHSGGGQFVQRYAAGSRAADALSARGIDVRFVVANPSSYLYLTPERPLAGGAAFALPSPDIRRKTAFFNNYKYGLDRLNPYMRQVGPERIREGYASREITYLLGERDNDPRHPQLDRGRAAELEGATRMDRGVAFFRYLQHLYGPAVTSRQRLEIVPGVGHSARRMFVSNAGLEALYPDSEPIAALGASSRH